MRETCQGQPPYPALVPLMILPCLPLRLRGLAPEEVWSFPQTSSSVLLTNTAWLAATGLELPLAWRSSEPGLGQGTFLV